MPNPLADIWSFSVAAALPDGQLLVAAHADEMLKKGVVETTLLWFDGSRMSVVEVIDDLVRSIAVSGGGFVLVGEDGVFRQVENGRVLRQLDLSSSDPAPRGPIRACHAVGRSVVIAGFNGTVLRLDQGSDDPLDASGGMSIGDVNFQAMTGGRIDDLRAIDSSGGVWRFDGSGWRSDGSPTNLVLTALCQCDDGRFVAVGRHGILLEGTSDGWQVVDFGIPSFDIYSVCEWKREIYVAGTRGLLSLSFADRTARMVDTGPAGLGSFYHVIGAGDSLWSVGPKDIGVLRRGQWRSLFQ